MYGIGVFFALRDAMRARIDGVEGGAGGHQDLLDAAQRRLAGRCVGGALAVPLAPDELPGRDVEGRRVGLFAAHQDDHPPPVDQRGVSDAVAGLDGTEIGDQFALPAHGAVV